MNLNFKRDVHAFLFEPQDLKRLDVYRILIGTLLLFHGFLMLPNLEAFFGPEGVLSQESALRLAPKFRLNFFLWFGDSNLVLWSVYAAMMLGAAGLTLGFYSKLSCFIAYLAFNSICHRNLAVLYGVDTVIRIMLLLLCFAPIGRAYSLDLKIRKRRKLKALSTIGEPWSLRLMQFQFMWIYLATTLEKGRGSMWIDGTAVYYSARLNDFKHFSIPYLFDNILCIKLFSWGTLIVEGALGTLLVFKDLRFYLIILAIVFHLGLDFFMLVPLFQYSMIIGLVLFIDEDLKKRFYNLWQRSR